jgi:hypothetical protein
MPVLLRLTATRKDNALNEDIYQCEMMAEPNTKDSGKDTNQEHPPKTWLQTNCRQADERSFLTHNDSIAD